jgi:hypothetical protein
MKRERERGKATRPRLIGKKKLTIIILLGEVQLGGSKQKITSASHSPKL